MYAGGRLPAAVRPLPALLRRDGPLPPDCYGDMAGQPPSTDMAGQTPPQQCPSGEQACGLPGEAACAPGFYCVTGCCVALIP